MPDGSFGQDLKPLADAIANGTRVNFGGVGIGVGGERVRCWALDDFQLRNVSLLKIDAVCSADIIYPYLQLQLDVGLHPHRLAGLATLHVTAGLNASDHAGLIKADADETGLRCMSVCPHAVLNNACSHKVRSLRQEGAEPLVAYGARETISASRPVISFELREDKPVSAEMIAALEVPKHVANFQLLKFCVQTLNYTVVTPPGAGRGDLMLIPADIAASRGLGPGLPLDLIGL